VERVDYANSFLEDPTFADLLIRNPTAEQRADICSRGEFLGTMDECLHTPVAAIVDMRLNNVATLRTDGIDAIGKYVFNGRLGTFEAGLNATYLMSYSQARFRESLLQNLVSTTNNPIDLRMRGSLGWNKRGVGINAFINYADNYRDLISSPSRRVDSWTTVDVQLSYASSWMGSELFSNTTLSLSAENIFNSNPPFVNNPSGIGYDNANADLMGRFVSVRLRKDW
jgi:hypothetical protein